MAIRFQKFTNIIKWRTFRNSSSISSFLLRSSTINKPFSSSSSSNLLPNPQTLPVPSSDPQISQEPISKSSIRNEFPHSDDPEIANLQIPISRNYQDSTNLSQSHVISVLLSLKHNALSAIRYFKWAEEQPGFNGGVESFCVLFHIVVSSNCKHKMRLVTDLVSSKQCSDAIIVNQGLVESAKKFAFRMNASAFQFLLDGFVMVGRIDDAIVCFNFIIENFGTKVKATFAYRLLKMLIKRDNFKEVEEVLDKMISNGTNGDNGFFLKMMEWCVSQKKLKEAEGFFRKAWDIGFKLDEKTYDFAVRVVCMNNDINGACELLNEMIEKGLAPFTTTFMNLIRSCVRQKKFKEALRLKDEMISHGIPMDTIIATDLIKGCCELGDLETALSMFATMIKGGISPNRFTFLVLIKGCLEKGDMEKACEIHNLMFKKGFKLSFYLTILLINGLLDAKLWEKAVEHLNIAAKAGIIKFYSFIFLMSCFCADGKVDEAQQLWHKIMETGNVPTVVFDKYVHEEKNVALSDAAVCEGSKPSAVTYTILMDGYFKKGEVEKALKVFDEMGNQRLDCKAFTYNTIIHGLCYNGQTSRARKMLEHFPVWGDFKPSFTTYNFIVDGFIKEGDMDSVSSVSAEMSERGLCEDVMLKRNLVEELCTHHNLFDTLKILEKLVDEGSQLDISAYETLIYKYSVKRKMRTAMILFSQLIDAGLHPSQYILNCMVTGYQAVGL